MSNSFYETDSSLETEWYGKIFNNIINRDGFSSNIIENYNNEMRNRIPAAIKNTKFETRNGFITFDKIDYIKPREQEGGVTIPLTPKISRQKTIPYFADIYADVIFTPKSIGRLPNGEEQFLANAKPEIKYKYILGSLPVMLGSELCHLQGLSDEEKMEKGECFNDPLGYFIVKSERVILTQVKLRSSSFLLYKLKENIIGTIAFPTEQGTSTVVILIEKKIKSLRIVLQHLRKNGATFDKSYPIFLIYKILGMEIDEAIDQIKKFIPSEYHSQADYYIKSSIVDLESLNLNTIDDCVDYVKTYRSEIEKKKEISREQIIPDIQDQLFYDIKSTEDRLEHLSMYAARMLEYIMGVRELDDRDAWGNICLESAGKSISKLFKRIWTNMRKSIEGKVILNDGLKAFLNEYPSGEIKDNFIRAFGPNAWGPKRSIKPGENITEALKRDTPVAVFSQITKLNSAASRQAKKDEPRMVHPSQMGYVCLFETPEGEGCGLIKNLATSCYISLDRDPALYQALIKPSGPLGKFVTKNKEKEGQVPLLINGIINGWCDEKVIVPELKSMRKYNSQIAKDVCIFYNQNNRCVEIYCDGGRTTRPLFVVDTDGQLVVLKKRLINADVPTLIREGCIEYIDAREQEYIMLAQRTEQILERNKEVEEVNSLTPQFKKLETYLPIIAEILTKLSSESDDKSLKKLIETYNEIGTKEDNNDREEILSYVAIKAYSFIKENKLNASLFPEKFYEEMVKDSREFRLHLISQKPQYTHCEIDPTAMFSISASLVPMANRQAGPRTGYQAGMNKQALGQYHSNEAERFDASYKMIYYPTKALFQNDLQNEIGLNAMPNGQTLSVAIMALPDNPEDGIIFKEEAVKYGSKFDMCKKMTTISIAKTTPETTESFERPPIQPGRERLFHAIDEHGLPKLDAYIRQGDCIIGKVRRYIKDPLRAGEVENVCEYAGIGEEGYVDRILITNNAHSERVVKVKIRKNRKYIPGDKMACLTPDHQVFTKNRGWVSIKEVLLEDNIATLSKNQSLEYQKPYALHHFNAKNEVIYEIKTSEVQMKITKNHRLYYSLDKENWELKEAQELASLPQFYLKSNTKILSIEPNLHFKEIICEGSVHCISIPNEVFYVKHNDTEHWTGNSRYSQKGTISRIIPSRMLPRIASGPNKGVVPDIFINPHGQPSRMTLNKIIEIRATKAAAIKGTFFNSTTFRRGITEGIHSEMYPGEFLIEKTLKDYGLDTSGKEEFEIPLSDGSIIPLEHKIFFGLCHYQALRHHVSDKIQMRARQGVKANTRQPVSGRSKEGGLRVGEMERDALISHGGSALLRERLCDVSDAYTLPICSVCGVIAITDHVNNVYSCGVCGPTVNPKIGTIRIPYVVKLLLFYLNACGIHMTFQTKNAVPENGRMEENFLL